MQSMIIRYFTCLVFSLCLMVLTLQPSLAVTSSPSINLDFQIPAKEISLALDNFLDSIPPNYYAIPTPEAVKKQLDKGKTIVIDVREPKEYQAGHIPQAINIPLRTLSHNLDQIPPNSSIIVYCSTGYRSAMAVMTLNLLGYENVQGFPASFTGWKAAGEAIART